MHTPSKIRHRSQPIISSCYKIELTAQQSDLCTPELLVAPGSSEAEVLPQKRATVAVLVGLPAWTPAPVSVDTRTNVLYSCTPALTITHMTQQKWHKHGATGVMNDGVLCQT